MSTEHQKYSTENQSDAIRAYAAQRGFDVVRTYADNGRSGLRLDGREALQQLIDDVRARRTDFNAVLVYDVSRWGRFQDADESAYYEYICKEAGITVHYCAEQFENDGSLSATIIKGMKRAMAGEYSRELSTKVFAGQCRLITLGFRQGGTAGYGLRRLLIDEHRQSKGELAFGAHKSIQTDRVVLVPGPDDERAVVRDIYGAFITGEGEAEIAASLNERGLRTDFGRPWTRGTVHQVLTNEKYIGNNVFNRISFKLKRKRVANPSDMWVRADSAFEPVIDRDLFFEVRGLIQARSRRYTNEQMLGKLEGAWKQAGWLSALIIDEREDMPSSSAYRARFGSLVRAYRLVGYIPDRNYDYVETNRVLRAMHADVVANTLKAIGAVGGDVRVDSDTDLLIVNDEFSLALVICRSYRLAAGAIRWRVRLDLVHRPDLTVAVRLDTNNQKHLDYYVLPTIDVHAPKLRLAEENSAFLDGYRFDSLESIFTLARRSRIEDAA